MSEAAFPTPIELMGVSGSPYTRKMLSLLRYRRLPYRLYQGSYNGDLDQHPVLANKPRPRIPLLPTFFLVEPSGAENALCDSTPIIRKLEFQFAERPVLPAEPRLAWLNDLLEDFFDEWLTKPMFQYRWSYPADSHKAGQILPRWGDSRGDNAAIRQQSERISRRQTERLAYVGSNEHTAPIIEKSFEELLERLDKLLSDRHFLLGNKPASCDFALFGQLSSLALFDPTPQRLILERAPRIYAWTENTEDLSGFEYRPAAESGQAGQPNSDAGYVEFIHLTDSFKSLLEIIGRYYAPYLLANAAAEEGGAESFSCEIDGKPWQQPTFRYQARCLEALRRSFSELPVQAQLDVLALLTEAGFPEDFTRQT